MNAELTKNEVLQIFHQVDAGLHEPMQIIILGAAALLVLDIVERGTRDIDVAPRGDAKAFQKAAAKLKVDVDIVSVCTTVDFDSQDLHSVFQGKHLRVLSLQELDLIKSKLERYRKQDPSDIDKIIRKINLSFVDFRHLALEALTDYVGRRKTLALSILVTAENHYAPAEVAQLQPEIDKMLAAEK